MKKIMVFAIFITLTLSQVFSQDFNQVLELSPFDKLKVTNSVNVYPTKGDKHEAKIVARGIDIEHVEVEVKGKTLHVGLSRGIHRDFTVEVYLSYTQLWEVDATSSARVSFQDTISGNKITFTATTNAQIDAEVNLKTLDLAAGAGGSIRLGGKVGSYEAQVRNAGILSAAALDADSAFVSVGSRGVAKVFANELIEANVRTGGSLTYSKSTLEKRIQTGIGATIIEQ